MRDSWCPRVGQCPEASSEIRRSTMSMRASCCSGVALSSNKSEIRMSMSLTSASLVRQCSQPSMSGKEVTVRTLRTLSLSPSRDLPSVAIRM